MFAGGVVGCDDLAFNHPQPSRFLQLLRGAVEVGRKNPRSFQSTQHSSRRLQPVKVQFVVDANGGVEVSRAEVETAPAYRTNVLRRESSLEFFG